MSESPEPRDNEPKETPAAKADASHKAEAAVAAKAAKPEAAAASPAPVEIKVEPEPRPAAEAPARRRSLPPFAAKAAALAGAVAIGWAAGHATSAMRRAADPAEKALLAVDWHGVASGLQKSQADAVRMAADVQALKGTLAALKDAVDRAKQEAAGRFAQVSERLDRTQKIEQEVATRVSALAERVDSGPRLAQIVERLDRMEKQAVAGHAKPAATVASAAEVPLRTGSIPEQKPVPPSDVGRSEQAKTEAKTEARAEAKPEPKPAIEGWVLREVYDGVALIEGRNKRLLEVAPGQSLTGIGRVEAIEKRGRSWVVVTNRGIITSQPW
ncbi:MAG: hypothetical protein ACJ8CS_04680 [Microvirga sp.]